MKDEIEIIRQIAAFCFLVLGITTTVLLTFWLFLWISYAFAYLSP